MANRQSLANTQLLIPFLLRKLISRMRCDRVLARGEAARQGGRGRGKGSGGGGGIEPGEGEWRGRGCGATKNYYKRHLQFN